MGCLTLLQGWSIKVEKSCSSCTNVSDITSSPKQTVETLVPVQRDFTMSIPRMKALICQEKLNSLEVRWMRDNFIEARFCTNLAVDAEKMSPSAELARCWRQSFRMRGQPVTIEEQFILAEPWNFRIIHPRELWRKSSHHGCKARQGAVWMTPAPASAVLRIALSE